MRRQCTDHFPMFRSMLAGTALLTMVTLILSSSSALAQQAPADDGALAARVDQLEQQLVEMQVTIGTLETLAKGRPAGGGSYQAPTRSANGGDMAQMEIQIRALSGQVAALSRQVRAMQTGRVNNEGALTSNSFAQPSVQDSDPNASGGFGTVTVTNEAEDGAADPIGTILSNELDSLPASDGSSDGEQQVAAVQDLPPRQAYDKAYGYLLQQNYGAAEAAFGDFVQRYPQDKLAGNAQYWLGESHYVRGSYRTAATEFLKGYKTYGQSNKAPDSLLKLAMSLSRLGQKSSACATFEELKRRYPNAPRNILRRSEAERQRTGC